MATKFLHEAQRGASKGSIDLPLALLAGLSVGFVAFVMPADLLTRAVELSQLPSILSAAEPPLGTKARAAFALALSVGTVLAIFCCCACSAAKSVQPAARDYSEPERDFDAPRLRRSDVHPDAPSRRPILAARELGEPAPARSASPAPVWRSEDIRPSRKSSRRHRTRKASWSWADPVSRSCLSRRRTGVRIAGAVAVPEPEPVALIVPAATRASRS